MNVDMEPAACAAEPDSSNPQLAQQHHHQQQHQHSHVVPLCTSALVPVIPEFSAFKATRLSDIVCRRNVRLYRDRVQTIHPQTADQGNEKTWFLDRTCKLEPEYVEELVSEKRTVRPPGQWTVTAKLTTVTGQAQEPLELYCVTIHWPTSWLATRGYTSFTLGFETVEEAEQWHALVQRQLSALRVRAVSSKGDSSAGHSSKPSYDEGLGLRTGGSGNGAVARKTSQGFVAAALEHFWSSGSGAKDDKHLHAVLDGCDQTCRSRPCTRQGLTSPPADSQEQSACPVMLNQQLPACCRDAHELCDGTQLLQHEQQDSFSSSCTDGCDGTAQLLQQTHNTGSHFDEQRWVPYRHTNGVAIYHHKESAATCSLWDCGQDDGDGGPAGSEYMASSIVKGCPDECLSVLVDLSSNTTILGPASKIELLEDGEERQVLRLTVEATGMARRLCAPREVIVERLFKREECGVDVILFSSCEEPQPSVQTLAGSKRHRATAAAVSTGSSLTGRSSMAGGGSKYGSMGGSRRKRHGPGMGAVAAVTAVSTAALAAGVAGSWLSCCVLLLVASLLLLCCARFSSSRSRFQSLWYKPVRAYVQGGYTISPREDCNAVNSPECLVTCILKVDLRGFLGERSWLRPILDALGWVDAYVERMLMAVILVKDEVEQQRFLVQPFSILTNNHAARASSSMVTATSAGGSSAAEADDSREAATLRDGYSLHLRQQQLMRQRRRLLQQQQQQQQQQTAYMRAGSYRRAGFSQDDSARLAADGYWGSGITTASQAGALRPGANFYFPQVPGGGLLGRDYATDWPYKGPLLGAVRPGAGGEPGYGRQQQDILIQGADGSAQHKRSAGQQSRQQGRLGRMASRIYSLRPRLRKGDNTIDRLVSASAASAAMAASSGQSSSIAAGLYTQLSASFKSSLAVLSAADAAASAATGFPTSAGVPVEASGAADAAAAAAVTPAPQSGSGEAAGGSPQPLAMSDTAAVLARLGLPADTAVVGPQYYIGGAQGPAAKYSSLNPRYWSELHVPGTPAPFKLRGASYLADRTKVDGGMPQFVLGSVDLVETAGPTQHISRFLPAVRCNDAAYSFVVNLIIPGTPVLSLVAVFINEHHPDILDGPSCSSTAPHHVPSKSSPAIAEHEPLQPQQQQQQQQQQPALRRLSSSSSNLVHGRLSESSQPGGVNSNSSPVAYAASGPVPAAHTDAADNDDNDNSPSRYETPVGGRPVDAISEDSSDAGHVVDPSCSDGTIAEAVSPGEEEDQDLGPTYQRPHDVNDWQPFDFALHRFLHGGPQTRQSMFKLIPHIAEGSWVIKQSVGTVPVILGNKLETVYYQTERYIEATVDVTSTSAAAYITSMVRGATKSLVIDLGFVLEGQRPEELPEALLGAFRLNHMDCTQAKRIDTTQELPLRPRPLQQHQLSLLPAAAVAAAAAAGSQPAGVTDGAAAEAAAAAPEVVSTPSWQPDSQRRACSASGDMQPAAGAAAAAPANTAAQQQQQAVEQPVQRRAGPSRASVNRNSAVQDSGRTMTGHARSRSAASAEELYHTHGLLLTEGAAQQQGREQRPAPSLQHPADVRQQLQQPQQEQQAAKHALTSSIEVTPTGTAPADAGSTCGSSQGPPSIRTHAVYPGLDAACAATADACGPDGNAAAGQCGAAGVVPTAARQLFGSLLPFGSSPGASSSSQHDRAQPGSKPAAGGTPINNHTSSSLYACGAVTTLSTSSTPTAAAAAAASSILSSPCTAGSMGACPGAAAANSGALLANATSAGAAGVAAGAGSSSSSAQHLRSSLSSTPTAAGGGGAAAAAAVAAGGVAGTPSSGAGQHQRTSSGTSDVASRGPPGPPWPSSPPAPAQAQELSASKLSAAAFISRAHAAALAASAQRRGQRGTAAATTNSAGHAGGSSASAGLGSFGSPGGFSSHGGEYQHSGSPGHLHASALAIATAGAAAGGGAGAAGATSSAATVSDAESMPAGSLASSWQSRRQRASSTGVTEAAAAAAGGGGLILEHHGSLNAHQQQQLLLQPEGAVGSCPKISATEQLRLTHHALRASATGGGGGGGHLASGSGGQSGSTSHLVRSSSGVLSVIGRQSSGPPLAGTAAGPAPASAAEGNVGQGGPGSVVTSPSGLQHGTAVQHHQQAVPVKRRTPSHRRFASMGAMQ